MEKQALEAKNNYKIFKQNKFTSKIERIINKKLYVYQKLLFDSINQNMQKQSEKERKVHLDYINVDCFAEGQKVEVKSVSVLENMVN